MSRTVKAWLVGAGLLAGINAVIWMIYAALVVAESGAADARTAAAVSVVTPLIAIPIAFVAWVES